VPGLANIVAIASDNTSSFAVGADGTLWAWGRNDWA
jgi:alpha-tubulin suppressor-like RCC1 family protein